jgi:hypothetical protein
VGVDVFIRGGGCFEAGSWGCTFFLFEGVDVLVQTYTLMIYFL